MTREEVLEKVNAVIQDVFDDDSIRVSDETVASDVDGWDSLMHITLIGTIEDEFDIKFAMKDVVGMKNVGQMVDLIMEQLD
ncbi:acyl carrier protein [Oribacterium sp. oral taxon 108]|jgi:acyl carrier protein|uniref:acyl carrier protein n=1 Tax=Oribacterium sp. oral taxon 108 TaxID=712414 RepID=UPI00020DD7A2|nr:acyl carrier protein [Oribacterium sp. oral taxon 108]EGL36154.1 putative acyl carrier protein [Oribacterium sp. oral taxon 108 str. F0425]